MSESNDDFKRCKAILCNALAGIDNTDRNERTLLWWATFEGQREVVEVLVGLGADVDKEGLGLVFLSKTDASYRIKLEADCGVSKDENECLEPLSPILIASVLGHHEILLLILNAGALVDQTLGGISLLNAATNGHKKVCEVLLQVANLDKGIREISYFAAVNNGHTGVAELFIRFGVNIETRYPGGFTGLIFSSLDGHWKTVEMLIQNGADLNAKNDKGRTALFTASSSGERKVVEVLINAGADVESSDNNSWFPLYAASFKGHREVVEVLINAGADVESREVRGRSSVFVASYMGHREVVEVLINAGADVESSDNDSWFPLFAASFKGHREVVEVLINAGADVESRDEHGRSSLFGASFRGHREVVEFLINAGADVKSRNEYGQSSLIVASHNGHREVVEVLINAGADVESREEYGRSSLFAASHCGHREVVEVLINAGANVESRNKDGWCSLFAASVNGHEEVVEVLINAGADVESREEYGQSSLFAASRSDHREVVEVLINAGADVESRDESGTSSLDAVTLRGHLDVVRLLIEHGAKISPHHIRDAVESGNKDLVSYFVQHYGAVMFEDDEYTKAIALTIERGSVDMLQILVRGWDEFSNLNSISSAQSIDDVMSKTTDCSLAMYRMLMILATKYATPTPQPPPILMFLDDDQCFQDGFILEEHCIPGAQPCPAISHIDIDSVIKLPGIGSVEYARLGMAKKMTEEIDGIVHGLESKPLAIFTRRSQKLQNVVKVRNCGSTGEGTSVGLPDEYDYLFKYTALLDDCRFIDFGHGYRFCEAHPDVMETISMWRTTGSSRGSIGFHKRFWGGIQNEKNSVIVDIPTVQGGGNASTEVKIQCFLPGTDRPFLVSVDLVPVIHFDNAWPETAIQKTWLMDKETLKSWGFALVAKPPHKESKMGKAMKESDRVKLYRLSCSHLETEHIAKLEARVKNALIAAKCIRNPDVCKIFMKESNGVLREVDKYLTTYLLKTIFLHNVEDFLETEKTLLQMVYIIYSELEVCLSKGFIPNFWENHVNVLEGLSIDVNKSLQVARLMKSLIGHWYHGGAPDQLEGAAASSPEGATSVGYHVYKFDTET